MTQDSSIVDRPSLEGVVESGMLRLASLHPGGLDTTRQLIEACNIQQGSRVLDVACGTGETACFLAETLGARVFGVDHSEEMVRQAVAKASARGLSIQFSKADAADLPFEDSEFDAAICECTLCFLDKPRALAEMTRVVRPGGCVGMHDLCWEEDASDQQKRTLAELEGEQPETLEGWRRLFEGAGLEPIAVVDKSEVKLRWMQVSRRQLGLSGQFQLIRKIIRRWGVRGLWNVLRSMQLFSSKRLGYCLVVGKKP